MGTEAKRYLDEHGLPQLFEALMAGLIHNRPDEPLDFMDRALTKIRQSDPDCPVIWDMFVDSPLLSPPSKESEKKIDSPLLSPPSKENEKNIDSPPLSPPSKEGEKENQTSKTKKRPSSLMKAVDKAKIPNVPVILFIGELISDNLALQLAKAEMGKHPDAKVYLLEGYPKDANQVVDFQKKIKRVNMAIILDYDEKTLRAHMTKRGITLNVINRKIREFKSKTLPSAKYFDDRKLLHLIPGEQSDDRIFDQISQMVSQAISTPIPASSSSSLTSQSLSSVVGDNAETNEQVGIPHGLPNDAPVILVIGAPGSNKTMFAKKIAEKYEKFVHISMGEVLRRKIDESPGDVKCERIGAKMDSGNPVSTKTCRELIYTAIQKMGANSWGYVIEGYPRTEKQVKDFETTFCLDNISKRNARVMDFNTVGHFGRVDDRDESTSRSRIAVFKKNTLPMLKYLEHQQVLKVVHANIGVHGDNEIEHIFQKISSFIDALFIERDDGNGKSLVSSKNFKQEV